jgi:membrane protein
VRTSPLESATIRRVQERLINLARRLIDPLVRLAHDLIDPLVRFNFLDRSLALGAQAFGALIPLLIVVETAEPGNDSLADGLIKRFNLGDAAADSLRRAFAPPTDSTTITAFGVVVLIVSALSFTRRMQRLYEESWSLPQRGLWGTGSGLLWLAFLVLYGTLHPLLDGVVNGFLSVALSLGGAFLLALMTPYLLLGRRLHWHRLLLQAGLTAIGLLALGVWSTIYMPKAIGSSAAAYGTIGVAFAMLTWLWGLGIVLVISAVYGSPLMKWRELISDVR